MINFCLAFLAAARGTGNYSQWTLTRPLLRSELDVTLISHTSIDRLWMAEELARRYSGPVVVAVLIVDGSKEVIFESCLRTVIHTCARIVTLWLHFYAFKFESVC